MAILHVQSKHDSTTSSGGIRRVPPEDALRMKGPHVQVIIRLHRFVEDHFAKQGLPIPSPINGIGLIDTGASTTCVDENSIKSLRVAPIDVLQVSSASHTSNPQNAYPINIELLGLGTRFDIQYAIAAPLEAQGIQVLIGRDILQHCTIFYNGKSGQITLSI